MTTCGTSPSPRSHPPARALRQCDRCGTVESTVRLVRLIEQNTGPGGSHRACATCVPHNQGEFDKPTLAQKREGTGR